MLEGMAERRFGAVAAGRLKTALNGVVGLRSNISAISAGLDHMPFVELGAAPERPVARCCLVAVPSVD